MKKGVELFLATLTLLIIFSSSSFANSSYVLPYPSSMPGSFMYRPHLFFEIALKYWYFGDFGQFKYNLKESDKYLVEAKILFEYNQYLLGFEALQKSDSFFKQPLPYLDKAKKEGKDISENREILSKAAEKHIEVLEELKNKVPPDFVWQPEKSKASNLNIKSLIESSVAIREKYL